MTNNIQYKIHLLLHFKYKILATLIIYLLIFYIYNPFLDNYNIAECMMRSNSYPSLEADKHLTNNNLEFEVLELTEQNLSLKQELRELREFCVTEKAEYEHLRDILGENQRYLINENRHLRANLLEAEQTIGKKTSENVELKAYLEYQQHYSGVLRRNLETIGKHMDELTTEIESLKKDLSNQK